MNAPADRPSGVATAVSTARAILAQHAIHTPDDLHVARLAQRLGADVAYRTTAGADGRLWRAGGRALIAVDERTRGTPRARWTIAHELGHLLLHDDLDAIDRIHGGAAMTGNDRQRERQADAFATELLMPEGTFAARCGHARPTIADLDALGAEYGTSLTATGRRYTEYARAACAMLECKGGRVVRASRSAAFAGEAKQRRILEETTMAARVTRGERTEGPERVTTGAWGSGRLAGEMTEHAVGVVESGMVLVWLWHEG